MSVDPKLYLSGLLQDLNLMVFQDSFLYEFYPMKEEFLLNSPNIVLMLMFNPVLLFSFIISPVYDVPVQEQRSGQGDMVITGKMPLK